MWYSDAADTDRQSKAWRYSLCFSIALHVGVVAVMAGLHVARALRASFRGVTLGAALDVTYTRIEPARPGDEPQDIVENIIGSLPDRLDQALKLDPSQRAQKMKEGMLGLNQISESSLTEITGLFDQEDRAYEPVEPRPPGPFDFDSQIPYSMKKLDSGGFVLVLLDKDGRTGEITHLKDEVTDDLRAMYEIFKMMEAMPAFRKLYMRFAAQYLPKLKGAIDE